MSRRRPRTAGSHARLSVLLWRHRHLVVAACLGAAVLLGLSVLRPAPEPGTRVLVVERPVAAGQALTEEDVDWREVPDAAVPAEGLADDHAVGARAAVSLVPGQVLTTAMTSTDLANGLAAGQRLVEVPVSVGARLAAPGVSVDVVGPDAGGGDSWSVTPTVLVSGARVVLVRTEGEADQWTGRAKVTFITLAVPARDASLVVGAATSGALGIVLSP